MRNGALTDSRVDSWDLVREAQRGSDVAFGHLYDRYYRTIYGYVLRRTRNAALTEDLTSETFLRALRKLGALRFKGKAVRAWIITIARNVVIDHHRCGDGKREIAVESLDPVQGIERSAVERSAEHAVLDRAWRAELRERLNELTPAQRQCVELRFYDGLSVADTAILMRRNCASVRALQHRAVRRLSEVVAERPLETRPDGSW